jgi:hypothetical protein
VIDDPLASFYALTPERLDELRAAMPLHASLIDELGKLVPFIKHMADESNMRKLSKREREALLVAAVRMSQIAIELHDNPQPTKQ